MSKLCLGTYLTILVRYKSKSCTQKRLVGTIMHFHSNQFDETDDSLRSNLVAGRKNPPDYVVEDGLSYTSNNYPKLISHFTEEVIPLIDQNKMPVLMEALYKLIENDDETNDECKVDVITPITKKDIREKSVAEDVFLAGVFLYVLKSNDNSNAEKNVHELNEKFFSQIEKRMGKSRKNAGLVPSKNKDSIYREAQEFCITYEKEIGLLPLCQIASFIDPLHNFVRPMYTAFCKCNKTIRKKILELKKFSVMSFSDSDWINKSIKMFDEKTHEKQLCSVSFLYDGAKYFHRGFNEYSNYRVEFDPLVFTRLNKQVSIIVSNDEKCSLDTTIRDYLEMETPKGEINPPLDEVWAYCSHVDTMEYDVTFWVSMMIITTCKYLYDRVIDLSKPYEEDITDISLGDSECLIETQEDMYLYALLELYKLQYSAS